LIAWAVLDLERTRRGPQRPLEHLQALRHAQDRVAEAIDFLVLAARDEGRSWGAIGDALEVSRQAVRQAAIRHGQHEERRAEDRQWKVPAARRARRHRWFRTRQRAG
jgi:hypothetical protein